MSSTQNPYAGRSPAEFLIEDLRRGTVRFRTDAEPYFRRRFAEVGMVLDQHLASRQALLAAWVEVLERSRQRRMQQDLARVASRSDNDVEKQMLHAAARKDFKEARRLAEIYGRRRRLKAVPCPPAEGE